MEGSSQGPREKKNPLSRQQVAEKRDWHQWRGANRDGHVPRLPGKLPKTLPVLWQQPLVNPGLAGVCATSKYVIVADRDETDTLDVWSCFDAKTGKLLWSLPYPAPGGLDYGNSPRATPLVHKGRVFLLGAFGDLHCLDVKTGVLRWKQNLATDYAAEVPTWGYSSSPLIVDGKLIVNPGGENASLVALDPLTGKVQWQTAGTPAAYGAFVTTQRNGRTQLIGYDQVSLGGWDVASGKRLWTVTPPERDDFNVPTPIVYADGVLVSTENNGTRYYQFDPQGKLRPKPAARHANLAPDTTTPIETGGRVFGNWEGELFCLDAKRNLQPIWHKLDDAYADYCSYLADENRVLILTVRGELRLLDARADAYRELGRIRLFAGRTEVYSHPAIVGHRFYVRDSRNITCFELMPPKP